MREVHALYPGSPMLDTAFISALYEAKELPEAVKEAREFQARAKSGRYPASNLAESRALLGTLLWAAGDKPGALAEFSSGAAIRGSGPSNRWAVWSRVREGQLLDALGRRGEALDAYHAAYQEKDPWNLRPLIKACLKAPCVGEKYPGHFSPY